MNILTDRNTSYPLDSLVQPSPYGHFWVLDSKLLDFRLARLTHLEESTGRAVRLRVANTELVVPASWSAVVVDRETSQVDWVPLVRIAAMGQELLLFSPSDSGINLEVPAFLDLVDATVVYPMMDPATALVTPVCARAHNGRVGLYCVILGHQKLGPRIENLFAGDLLT